MSFTVKASKTSGGGSEKPPVGNHLAVLVGLFDMGHQWQDPFGPKDKGYWAHRAFFVWELVGEKQSGADRNHVIGIDLTVSLNEKAKLRKWVEARTGKVITDGSEFDITSELGQPCLLNVIEKNGYPKVDGVAAVPKGLPAPKPSYTPTCLTLDQFRAKTPLPEWCPWLYGSPLEDHIAVCKEIGGQKPTPRKKKEDDAPAHGQPTGGEEKDPIPF